MTQAILIRIVLVTALAVLIAKGGAADTMDVSLAVADLGAAYLGGTTLHELCLAGRAKEGRPGALAAASAAFSWSPAPWCPVVF